MSIMNETEHELIQYELELHLADPEHVAVCEARSVEFLSLDESIRNEIDWGLPRDPAERILVYAQLHNNRAKKFGEE